MLIKNKKLMMKMMKVIILMGLYFQLLSDGEWLVKGELERFEEAITKPDGSLSFLVVGDWGRRGSFNQTLVASQMGIVGEKLDVDFIVSTGDNFYDDGLTGITDPAFQDSFTNIYTAPSLQKQWYAVLGNHDYRGDALSQLSPVLRQMDNKWLCLRSFIVNAEIADLFFVDTTPLVNKYFTEKGHTYDWRGVLPQEKYISTLLKDLDKALKESNAKWKFVIGHHTLMSAGHHGNTQELVDQLLPILKENNVDFYVNGHDHCLEHITHLDSGIEFLTSGGGSKAWRGDVKRWIPKDELKLYYDGQGFVSVQVTQIQVDVLFYDVSGNVIYQWSSTKPSLYASV